MVAKRARNQTNDGKIWQIFQSMSGGSWCKSGNSHMRPCLHERLLYLFGIVRAIQKLCIRNTEFLVAEA